MTKERVQGSPGGTKKFLYSGPVSKRRGPQFDDDVDDREWNFQPTLTTAIQDDDKAGEFDMDGIWSIKKNVSIPGVSTKPTVTKVATGPVNLTVNSPANYYSRYGNMPGTDNGLDGVETGQMGGSGKTWNQGTSRTYSYTRPGQSSLGSPSQISSTMDNGSRQGGNNLFKPGSISQGGRTGGFNPSRYNRQF